MWVETRALNAEPEHLFGCHLIPALDGSSTHAHRRSKSQGRPAQVFDNGFLMSAGQKLIARNHPRRARGLGAGAVAGQQCG